MKGSRTSATVERKFRKKLLELGTAAAAARALKIPESTGAVLARRANGDPKFVEARSKLNAHALEEVESYLLEASRVVQGRILEKPLGPEDIAKLQTKYGLTSFHFQDPRPQYYGQLVNAHRSLMARKKLALEQGEKASATEVIVRGATEDDDPTQRIADSDPSKDTENDPQSGAPVEQTADESIRSTEE